MFKKAGIVLEKTTYSFDKPYDYAVPSALAEKCKPGCRVVVPFGKGNTERQGLILSVEDADNTDNLKSVIRVADVEPVLSDEMLKMCEWFHQTLFCTYFDAVNMLLPAGISLKMVEKLSVNNSFDAIQTLSTDEKNILSFIKRFCDGVPLVSVLKEFNLPDSAVINGLIIKGALLKSSDAIRKMKDATLKSVRAKVGNDELSAFKLTTRQTDVAKTIIEAGSAAVKEVQYFTGASLSVIDALVNKGVAEYFEKEIYRLPHIAKGEINTRDIVLTSEQQQAFDTLSGLMPSGGNALLYGVTGSGKTQVFLKLVDKAVEENRGVIIMVPEISLTPQTISIFNNRYGDKIAVFHSAMSLGQRMDEWKRIKEGKALIAVGTRSAVFAPFKDIGLIIMDEEQEHTYKSEQSPRYHARDVARFRAAYHKALFLMASATPSVETYSAAKSGKYTICTLNNRYGNAVLPDVEIVDMRTEAAEGNTGAISRTLYSEIYGALQNGNQAIVLLNRRGHNTYISCPSCGYVAACPNCSVSMTYHSANKRLMCHYCGYSVPIPQKCPDCGEDPLKFSGIGTQKVQEELEALFPEARVLRLDADSTASRDSYSEYLTAFSNGDYDIMLGTQMVAKGLDFPRVTVVGVLGADNSMNSEDYRSVERTFSLLTQVIGRAGRGDNPGVAVIQTQNPDNNIITLAQRQDYDAFYNGEITLRKALIYPPYCDIISICVQSVSSDIAKSAVFEIFENIKTLTSGEFTDVKLIILGPAAAAIPKINNKYRFRILIKTKNNKRLREMLNNAVNIKKQRDVSIVIDINPEAII